MSDSISRTSADAALKRNSLEPARGSVVFAGDAEKKENNSEDCHAPAPAPAPASAPAPSVRRPPPPLAFPSSSSSSSSSSVSETAPVSPRPPPPEFPVSPRFAIANRPPVPKASPRDMVSALNAAVYESTLADTTASLEHDHPPTNHQDTIAAKRQQKALGDLHVPDRAQFLSKLHVTLAPANFANAVCVNFGGDIIQLTRTLENNPFNLVVHGSGGKTIEEIAFSALCARKNVTKVFEYFVQNKDLTETEAIDAILNIMFRNALGK